jgi:hypothetical protein
MVMNEFCFFRLCVSDYVTFGALKKQLLYPQSAQDLANAVLDAVDGVHADMDVLCQLLDVAGNGDDFRYLQRSARLFSQAVRLRGRPFFDAPSGSLYYSVVPNSNILTDVFFTVTPVF